MRAAASSIASGRPSSRAQMRSMCSASPAASSSRESSARARRRNRSADGAAAERRDRQFVLAGDAQRGAAGHDELRARRRGQQAADLRRRVEELLEVVDHQQQRAAREQAHQPFALGGAQLLRDLGGDERGVGERGERDEAGAVGELRGEPVGQLDREAGLADAAGPGEREQAHVGIGEQRGGGDQVGLAAEQRGRGSGEGGRGQRGRRDDRGGGRGRGGVPGSSAGSWARIADSSRCSSRPGSRPRSSTSDVRTRRSTSSASAWRPQR